MPACVAILRGSARLIAAAALLLVVSRPAVAGCGEYVHVRGKPEAATHSPLTPADCPCSNGQCDRPTDPTPAPTPPAPSGQSATDAALTAVIDLSRTPGRPGWADPLCLPTSAQSSVFHPPRA